MQEKNGNLQHGKAVEKTALVGSLSPEEYEVYIWLLQAYSIGWIAETLGLKKRKVNAISSKVYKTLKVNSQSELIRYYVSLKKYQEKPQFNGEDFAYAMASYTDIHITKEAEI